MLDLIYYKSMGFYQANDTYHVKDIYAKAPEWRLQQIKCVAQLHTVHS